MLDKLTRVDIGILAAATVMAVGAFSPIVHLPIVGSLNYLNGGRGDGVYILGCSAAIVVLVTFGYRRMAGIVGVGALFLTMFAIVNFAALLSKAQTDLARSSNSLGPLRGLAITLGDSVGLDWGWLLLIGGALAVVVLAFVAPGEIALGVTTQKREIQDNEDESFAAADKIIADYLENRKISPAIRNQSVPQQTSFGKRRL